ncbi:MAG: gamma carbonic anhydrase family protein [Candidatus Thorarchaeota archaeon]|nr:gamma carbonic anhydrase family protein [Candidatus Thorarchaeota archaeon]MCK5239036.1 gamma carbonic anhydrase family protein [Candidatus Thorarchaeota archaeon]
MTIYALGEKEPKIAESAYIHPQASVIGDVKIGERVFVAPMASIRGDIGIVEIGDESNVQDGAVIHSTEVHDTIIGKRVNIGHNASIHANIIHDHVAIGMGAVVMLECIIAEGALIANAALLHPKTITEPYKIYAGVPAKYIRNLGPDDPARIAIEKYVQTYVGNTERYPSGLRRLD